MAPLDTPASAELDLTAPSLIQPLGVVPLLPSPLSPAVPVILPQAPSGPSYAIYLQPAHAQTVTPPQGLSPTPSCKATKSKDAADATTEKASSDATKSGASTRPGSLLPVPERPGAKNRDKEPAGERGSKRASLLEDSGSKKKFKEDLKGLENVSAVSTALTCMKLWEVHSWSEDNAAAREIYQSKGQFLRRQETVP